jgi:hypothetical protein
MEQLIHKNLELMNSEQDGGMEILLRRESFGGNAGHEPDGRPCAGANFYFDGKTGELITFTNKAPENIRQVYLKGVFIVAKDPIKRGKEILKGYVIKVKPNLLEKLEPLAGTEQVKPYAKMVIQRSVEEYNTEQKNRF